MGTPECGLRSTVQSWGDEDGDLVLEALMNRGSRYNHANQMPVGMIRSPHFPLYPTVLHALGDGWKLLAPPEKQTWKNSEGVEIVEYSWWLVKD